MKVAIIGAGDVGATAALRISETGLADVLLVDIVKGKALAKALDLGSAASIVRNPKKIQGTSNIKEIAGSDIVVITAGQTRLPGQTREDLLQINAKIVRHVSEQIAQYCPSAIVIVVTNPLDTMTYLVYRTTGFSPNQIIGMGGVSDCSRFNMLVAAELNTAGYHVQSVIIGPHSDQMLILPRFSKVIGTPLTELLPQERIEQIIQETRSFGAQIVELLGKGSAYFGPSAGIFSLVDSIINDRKNIVCASVYLSGQYQLCDLCLGVPVKLSRIGVEEIVELKLNESEKKQLLICAKNTEQLNRKLGE